MPKSNPNKINLSVASSIRAHNKKIRAPTAREVLKQKPKKNQKIKRSKNPKKSRKYPKKTKKKSEKNKKKI